MQSGKSFISNRDNSGPSTVPCGTSIMTGMLYEVAHSTKSCLVRFIGAPPFPIVVQFPHHAVVWYYVEHFGKSRMMR